jgi:hypothetical protein
MEMGCWKGLKFWKKRRNVSTTQDVATSTENPRRDIGTQVASIVTREAQSMDIPTKTSTQIITTVTRETQTDNEKVGGGTDVSSRLAELEKVLREKNHQIKKLEKELAVLRAVNAALPLIADNIERKVREFAEEPGDWYVQCREHLSEVGNLLKTMNNTAKKFKAAPGRNTKVDCAVQTEAYSKQQDSQAAEIERVRRRYREENCRLLDKMRDMREELLWYKARQTSERCSEDHRRDRREDLRIHLERRAERTEGCVKRKEAKTAFAKRVPEQSRKSTATSNHAAPNVKRAGPSAEQMDLGEGWSHVFRGGRVAKDNTPSSLCCLIP